MSLKLAVPVMLVALVLSLTAFAKEASQETLAEETPQNALAQCLVAHTSESDRVLLIKWIFTQFALAPQVAPLANIPAAERTRMDQRMGQLITRLLAVDCGKEARLAYGAEGNAAIQGAFQVLGQTAAHGLMQNAAVSEGMVGFAKYMDIPKVAAALGASAPVH